MVTVAQASDRLKIGSLKAFLRGIILVQNRRAIRPAIDT